MPEQKVSGVRAVDPDELNPLGSLPTYPENVAI
jgi:hypothetical protein